MLRNIPKIKVVLDSDKGIGIDECAELSRKISSEIEASNLAPDFEIEIGSPGVGEPLLLERQYLKNIERHIKVTTKEGKTILGVLKQVFPNDKIVVLLQNKTKNKTIDLQTVEIPFAEIKKSNIEIVF